MLIRFYKKKQKTIFQCITRYCTSETKTNNDNNESFRTKVEHAQATMTLEQYHRKKMDKMQVRHPSLPNDPFNSIETPSLIINNNTVMDNITKFNDNIKGKNIMIRPQIKSHKCADVIRTQKGIHTDIMNGITVKTVFEAERMMFSGLNFYSNSEFINNILLLNITYDLQKMWRYCSLIQQNQFRTNLYCCIDDVFQVHLWNYTLNKFLNEISHQIINHRSGNYLKIGIMITLNSSKDGIGYGIYPNTNDGKKEIIDIVNAIKNEYSNLLFIRGIQIYNNNKSNDYVNDNNTSIQWALDVLKESGMNTDDLVVSIEASDEYIKQCESNLITEVMYIYVILFPNLTI